MHRSDQPVGVFAQQQSLRDQLFRRRDHARGPRLVRSIACLERTPQVARTNALGFGRGERYIRALHGEKIALGVTRHPDRPSRVGTDGRGEDRVTETIHTVAVCIHRIDENRVFRTVNRRLHGMIAQMQLIEYRPEI